MTRMNITSTAKSLALRGLCAASIPFVRNAPQHLKHELRQRVFSGSLSDPRHRHRIAFQTVEETPSIKARREASEAIAGHTGAQDWRAVSAMLMAWDRDGTKSGDDKRVFIQGLETFSQVLFPENHLEFGAPRPYQLLKKLDQLFDYHPSEYGLAALAAWLRIETAWAIRGCGFAHEVSNKDWEEIQNLMADVDRHLSVIDGKCSALLAYVALKTAPFTVSSTEEMKSLWGTYADLAPDCGWGNEHFGEWMQPKWFGGSYDFDVAARQAMLRTEKAAGASAYACMYTGAASDEAWMMHSVDTELFEAGIHDMIRINGRDPSYIAGLFGVLSSLSSKRLPKGLSSEVYESWDQIIAFLDSLANDILRENLTAICPKIWALGVDGALDAITQTVRPAFDAGHNFAVGEQGVVVIA